MEIPNNTQGANPEANPNGAEQTPHNEGINNTGATQPQVEPTVNNNEGKTYSQKDLDGAQAKARGTAERETKRKLLAMLGLKEDEEDKLNAFKEAYQNSLSDEEKRVTELENLKAEKLTLEQNLEEKEYVIKALIELTGKNEEDVDKIVKMAKGLKTDDNTIEDAIKEVISMVNVEKPNTNDNGATNPNMPKGQEIQQPSTTVSINTENNPFKAGSINLTKQGELLRTNPELAKKLAAEAGVKLSI